MEQPRTRPPQARPRRTPPLPPQAQGDQDGAAAPSGGSATVYRAARAPRPAPGGGRRTLRFPNPRLTGRGSGLFCVLAMLLVGLIDSLLFSSSGAFYGVVFLLVGALTALWVRGADLVTAPVAVPIAFAVGIVPISEGTGGFGPQVMGFATTLAMNAVWLYGGTFVTGAIVTVRKLRLMARRAAVRRAGAGGGRQPSGEKAASQAPGQRRRTA
ncbi:DUF6542 domain-containing protein [Streptomyces sp. SDT5-1]|uniref:DUF6542 domain-containing protein n=1 Tax=Streptomyces sp. SDT5-1 TaxID=3406418 RepID=UPI003FCF5DD4